MVDMIQVYFINFPVFNAADSFLSIGVIIVIFSSLRELPVRDHDHDMPPQ
ncbi:signal peptidase II [Paenibacillus ihbetae]